MHVKHFPVFVLHVLHSLSQSRHELDPSWAHFPVAHATHVEIAVAPVAELAVPAEHFVQVEAPAADHDPAPHVLHVVIAVAPVVELAVPAEHFVQLSDPSPDHVPALHV